MWVANATCPAVLSPAPTEEEAEWVSERVWVFWRTETSLGTAGNWNPDCAAHSRVTMLKPLSWFWCSKTHFQQNLYFLKIKAKYQLQIWRPLLIKNLAFCEHDAEVHIQSTLNVLDITSKLCPTCMSETVHPKPTYMPDTELTDMFMVCFHTKSYMSRYKHSPATAIKQKQKKSYAPPSHYCTFYKLSKICILFPRSVRILGSYRIKHHKSGTQSLSTDAQDIKRKLLLFSLKVISIDWNTLSTYSESSKTSSLKAFN